MFTVYILQSQKDGTFYTGLTGDLDRRLREHNLGWEEPTRRHRPYKIVLTKQFVSRTEARKLEKKLKSGYLREKRTDIQELNKLIEGD